MVAALFVLTLSAREFDGELGLVRHFDPWAQTLSRIKLPSMVAEVIVTGAKKDQVLDLWHQSQVIYSCCHPRTVVRAGGSVLMATGRTTLPPEFGGGGLFHVKQADRRKLDHSPMSAESNLEF